MQRYDGPSLIKDSTLNLPFLESDHTASPAPCEAPCEDGFFTIQSSDSKGKLGVDDYRAFRPDNRILAVAAMNVFAFS